MDSYLISPREPSLTTDGVANSTWSWQDPNSGATNESGFTALPGDYRSEFGAFGEGYLRFSYANSIENIGKALDLLKQQGIRGNDASQRLQGIHDFLEQVRRLKQKLQESMSSSDSAAIEELKRLDTEQK
jgi:hypothetical protein